ncbi:hypothetical protein KRX57_02465 [Weeksellaceae bacterium TAE3-ERU29]|nr:hypothetical protein [Weeksellaceae bacterium TAE3-ERU29]
MKEYILRINTKRDFELFYGNDKIYVKRKFNGFVFNIEIYLNEKLLFKYRISQILFYRKVILENIDKHYNIKIVKDSILKSTIFQYKNSTLKVKSTGFIRPSYKVYSAEKLVLTCKIPEFYKFSDKNKIILIDKNDSNNLIYVFCFLISFSEFDMGVG